MKIAFPTSFDASLYYTRYLNLASGDDLVMELENISRKTLNTINKLQDEDLSFAYEEGKWSVGVLLQHICDAERVYAYRALRFLRKDSSDLPGFDENFFADNSKGYERINDFITEYNAVRSSSIHLYLNSNLENLDFKGSANGIHFTPRELAWLSVGHNLHHLNVLEEKYASIFKK